MAPTGLVALERDSDGSCFCEQDSYTSSEITEQTLLVRREDFQLCARGRARTEKGAGGNETSVGARVFTLAFPAIKRVRFNSSRPILGAKAFVQGPTATGILSICCL